MELLCDVVRDLMSLFDISGAPDEVVRAFAIGGGIALLWLAIVIFNAIEKARFRRWCAINGDLEIPMRPWRTIIPWHRAGSRWYQESGAVYNPRKVNGYDPSDERFYKDLNKTIKIRAPHHHIKK